MQGTGRHTLHYSAKQQRLHTTIRQQPSVMGLCLLHTHGQSLEKGGLHELTFSQKQSCP